MEELNSKVCSSEKQTRKKREQWYLDQDTHDKFGCYSSMTTSSITVHLLSLPLHRRHHQPRRHHHHCYDIYSKNLIRGIPAQFDWKRLQINYESSFPTKEESCKINICNPGIWKGYRCWRWWSKRITTLTISSRDIQTQILLTYLNMYMFSLTSMYSKQILGFTIYFWIDSYIDWIVILFEKEKRRYCYQAWKRKKKSRTKVSMSSSSRDYPICRSSTIMTEK